MKLYLILLPILSAVSILAAADIPPANSDLLRRAGSTVEKFWDQLQAVNCVETVEQQKLNPNGKLIFRQKTDFDYIAILQLTGNDLIVDESRTLVHQPEHENKLPLLITNGFSTFEFIFHPFYQGAFEFSSPEAVQVDGRALLQVKFRHVQGARSPSVLRLKEREYPVEWQGSAWIEPESGAIVRVSANLGTSMEDMGLKSLTADVRYAAIDFKGEKNAHWLPSIATIEVETQHQRWRNTHTFDKYKLFSVDVKTEVGKSK
jgi:hypothetical protein